MAMTDIVTRVKTLLHGSGLMEKPPIVRVAADASETITNPTIVFNLLSGEGASSGIAAGDILSTMQGSTAALSFIFYVLSVSTDAVTCTSTYMGSTASTASQLDGMLLELNAPRAELLLWNDISAVINGMLWPEVYLYTTESVTPDLSNMQADLQAGTERIVKAVQVIGGTNLNISHELHKNVATGVASTTVYAELFAIDASTVFVSSMTRVAESSTLNEAYNRMIATGAAAVAVGSMLGGGSLESSSKDSQNRNQKTPRQVFWQDFVALRASIAQDLSHEENWFEVVL